ncbi:NAD(P)/FAD-dependent oxidoreductase [Pseudoramibacter sp.]|uniref:NAD(P)/FAD-dependent oxidoreductase n=1 Tax=Pseudoramibacter sp. TaxID=2034862 RepID=UPI0025FEBF1A|nr:NAD(P)/FAD-dependent oxidoreductase [Pseudoramibacter sp.]MCH4072384.1 FAD-dependent oxidoreductase [Pseudoramibacter sp.]MCH4106155.1 FAD-dependent oxidoreductase [Pseudoramibacter sp.]
MNNELKKLYDVIVIGGGITGTGVIHELAKYDIDVALLERKNDIAMMATKGNGGVVHPGYDPHPGTLKAKLNPRGARMYPQLAKDLDFHIRHTGTMVFAYSDQDLKKVDELCDNARVNGVEQVERITGDQVRNREPYVSDKVLGALLAHTTTMVDPFEVAIAFAENAKLNGTDIFLESEVQDISKDEDGNFTITTNHDTYRTRYIVDAAGIYADDVAAMAGIHEYKIQGRHGNLCVVDNHLPTPIRTVMFPCPSPDTKGIALIPMPHGNYIIGSTATMRTNKEDTSNDAEGIQDLLDGAHKLIPNFDDGSVIRTFAGQRPVALNNDNDFWICESETVPHFIHAAGIQSPGVASSPGIAEYVRDLLADAGLDLKPRPGYNKYRKAPVDFSECSDEEKDQIIAQDPRYGQIVCRCETVTEGEIVAAIHQPLGAHTVEGVKRRTRAGMGRCQSGFCQFKVMKILARELGIPEEAVKFEEDHSPVLLGHVK